MFSNEQHPFELMFNVQTMAQSMSNRPLKRVSSVSDHISTWLSDVSHGMPMPYRKMTITKAECKSILRYFICKAKKDLDQTLFFKLVNYPYRAWSNNIHSNWCRFWCSFNTTGSFSCSMSKVCEYIIYFWSFISKRIWQYPLLWQHVHCLLLIKFAEECLCILSQPKYDCNL